MRYRFVMLMLCGAIGGCSLFRTDEMHYSVYFEPYSAKLDEQAKVMVHTAAEVALDNPTLPVALVGYAAPPDPSRDIPGLSNQRTLVVQRALVAEGVSPDRITTIANGTTDPKNLPNLAVRRVDISIGR